MKAGTGVAFAEIRAAGENQPGEFCWMHKEKTLSLAFARLNRSKSLVSDYLMSPRFLALRTNARTPLPQRYARYRIYR